MLALWAFSALSEPFVMAFLCFIETVLTRPEVGFELVSHVRQECGVFNA